MIEPDLLYELSRLAYARPTIEPVARPRDEAPSAFFAALLLLMTKRSSYGCPATHCRRREVVVQKSGRFRPKTAKSAHLQKTDMRTISGGIRDMPGAVR